MRIFAGTLLILVALAGCAQSPDADPDPGSSETDPATQPTGIELVNLWRVSDAEGESPDTWLRLDAGEFQLWRDCGLVSGSWRSGGALFLASVYGALDGCVIDNAPPTVPWLESAAEYRGTPEGFELMDADGSVVATLTIDGAPEPIPTAAGFYAEPPEITDEVLLAFEPPAPLPATLEPAAVEDLTGRWYSSHPSSDPFVEFAQRTWTGSDGCNGGGGTWAIDLVGGFLATSGPSTLIGCDGAPIPSWVANASSAGFDGEELVLLDKAGAELGRLTR